MVEKHTFKRNITRFNLSFDLILSLLWFLGSPQTWVRQTHCSVPRHLTNISIAISQCNIFILIFYWIWWWFLNIQFVFSLFISVSLSVLTSSPRRPHCWWYPSPGCRTSPATKENKLVLRIRIRWHP